MEEKLTQEILSSQSTIVIFIDENGKTFLLTSGELNYEQAKSLNKVLTIIEDHSIILKLVLGIEMLLNTLAFKIKSIFSKKN
jgi:hypothetical protein